MLCCYQRHQRKDNPFYKNNPQPVLQGGGRRPPIINKINAPTADPLLKPTSFCSTFAKDAH